MSQETFPIPKTRQEFIDRLTVDDELYTDFRRFLQGASAGDLGPWFELEAKYPWVDAPEGGRHEWILLSNMRFGVQGQWKPAKESLDKLYLSRL